MFYRYAIHGSLKVYGRQRIQVLENWVQDGLQPDLSIVLDVPVEVGMARSKARGDDTDRFESQAVKFKEAVRQCYLERATAYPDRMVVVDASRNIVQVQEQLQEILEKLWSQR